MNVDNKKIIESIIQIKKLKGSLYELISHVKR